MAAEDEKILQTGEKCGHGNDPRRNGLQPVVLLPVLTLRFAGVSTWIGH
jgi:hypothetical protein